VLHLSAELVARHLDRRALIDALARAFREADTQVPPREHHSFGDDNGARTLLIMPAWRPDRALGVKLVTVTAENSRRDLPGVQASYVLFDGQTGTPRAVLDGTELTRRRTAAASALAASLLAAPDASRLLMVGTGALAPHLIDTHALVRPIREVRVWGRRPERAAAVAASLAGRGFTVEVTRDRAASANWADIISCATTATEPLILGQWLRAGQHLDLVGSFTPLMREADGEAMARAEIYVDAREAAFAESGELVSAFKSGAIGPGDVRGDLSQLVRGQVHGRRASGAITLFKSVGTAIEDLAAAELACDSYAAAES
jgi:ornithine cyclodeaminase